MASGSVDLVETDSLDINSLDTYNIQQDLASRSNNSRSPFSPAMSRISLDWGLEDSFTTPVDGDISSLDALLSRDLETNMTTRYCETGMKSTSE